VYDIHVVMDEKRLLEALKKAGLNPTVSGYFCTLSFGVALETAGGRPVKLKSLKKAIVKCFQLAGKFFRWFDDTILPIPKGKYTSEGIFTVSRIENRSA
ncbi:MAG: hypothetical protein ACKOQ6_12270, partial [Bacteroidota bacterium]